MENSYIKLVDERTDLRLKFEHNSGPLINSNYCKQFKKLVFRKMTFTTYSYMAKLTYCLIQNDVVQIQNIITDSKSVVIVGKKFSNRYPLYLYPINSLALNISVSDDLSDNLFRNMDYL
ncbi:hypothetical protein RI129_000997 [Pyrocoelia pectoralis]|uniref:Uncharacterized protein n=1 Tax=Pyrocoelia pectoralis TaxID=417401 RepID=A0AAN7VUC1_9COLE